MRAPDAGAECYRIVGIETTGLNAGSDEIIEIGALLVGPRFVAAGEFGTLVKTTRPVPKNTTQLTGIEQTLLNREGASLMTLWNGFKLQFAVAGFQAIKCHCRSKNVPNSAPTTRSHPSKIIARLPMLTI